MQFFSSVSPCHPLDLMQYLLYVFFGNVPFNVTVEYQYRQHLPLMNASLPIEAQQEKLGYTYNMCVVYVSSGLVKHYKNLHINNMIFFSLFYVVVVLGTFLQPPVDSYTHCFLMVCRRTRGNCTKYMCCSCAHRTLV